MPDLAVVQHCHQRSKHALNAWASGPEALDGDAQPDPYRRCAGQASLQSVHHFTVGLPVDDARIATEAPCAHLRRAPTGAHRA